MRRREFISLIGGVAVVWPIRVRAQQPALPVVGFLRSASLSDATHLVTAFRKGLMEAGFVESQNVVIEFRSGENRHDRLKAMVAELVGRPVDVIVGNVIASVAAKATTNTVPIIFATGSDPVKDGLVTTLNRPGGNVTGVVFFAGVLGAKRLQLLRQVVTSATKIAMFVYPNHSDTEAERQEVLAAAQAIGQQLVIFDVSSEKDIEKAFIKLVESKAGALLVGTGAFLNSHRERVVALAAKNAMPAIYPLRESVAIGGLISYGASITDAYRQVGIYAGRVLKGEKPGDLPVMQSTKFELVINLKTAKTLGLDIPATLLTLADEVID